MLFFFDDYCMQKMKILIDPYRDIDDSKNTTIWLAENILSHNWKTRFFLDIVFKKKTVMHYFRVKKIPQWIKFLAGAKEPYFKGILLVLLLFGEGVSCRL